MYKYEERVGLESEAKAPRGLRVPVRVAVKNLLPENRQVPFFSVWGLTGG